MTIWFSKLLQYFYSQLFFAGGGGWAEERILALAED